MGSISNSTDYVQPNVQLPNQPGQPIGSGPTQQPVQPTIQVSAPGSVQQPGPSTPQTLPQSFASAATSVQPTTPISGVSSAHVSTTLVSIQIPQVSMPQFGSINLDMLHKIQHISISLILVILIKYLNNLSLVRLILVT